MKEILLILMMLLNDINAFLGVFGLGYAQVRGLQSNRLLMTSNAETRAVFVREQMMARRLGTNPSSTVRKTEDLVAVTVEQKSEEQVKAEEVQAVSVREKMMIARFQNEAQLRKIAAAIEAEALNQQQMEEEARAAKAAAEAEYLKQKKAEEQAKAMEIEKKAVATRMKMLETRLKIQGDLAATEIALRVAREAKITALIEARKQPKEPEIEAKYAAKYSSMSEEDRNFSILVDLGMINVHSDPDTSDYDASFDEEYCVEYEMAL